MKNFTQLFKAIILSALIALPLISNAQYCSISGTRCQYGDYIQSFSTTGATTNITNNATGCIGTTPAYVYYSSMTASAVQGTSFNFSITNGSYPYSEWFSIWVDWNNDGDFTDAGENAYTASSSSSSSGQVFTGSITVPATATPATTRMRVMCSYGGVGSPCSTYYSDGEIEDYNFEVLAACQTPTGLAVSNIASSTADFNWNAVTGVLGYEYVIDQVSTNPTVPGTLITTNSFSASGLTSSTSYYFHVRTKCGQSAFSGWTSIPFTTIFNPCPYPTGLTFTPNGTSVADFSWSPVTGSVGYQYIVSANPATPIVSGTSTTSTTATVSGLVGGNTYYFFVRNECSATSTSDWSRTQFTMPECYKPGSILVSNVSDTSADFIWGVTSNANYYEYQVDPNYNPPAGGSGFSATSGMSAHVEGLIPQTLYYVHLRSRCFTNDSSDWILDSLVTQMGCLRPNVIITGAQTNNVSARWDAVPNAIAYEYRVSTSASKPAFGTETSNTFTGPITLANDGKDYYLHVRAKCNSQFSFSQWVTNPLRTSALSVANFSEDEFDVSVYPNPVRDILQIRVLAQTAEHASLVLSDITGKIVLQNYIDNNSAELNMAGLPKGVYMLKYTDSNHSKILKVTKE